jgi:putative hydrolases of HD superfamily
MSNIEFLRIVGKLKHILRTGWVNSEVKNCETIASHMYRMGILSMMVPEEYKLDKNKCLKMSLVHDIAEAIVGDITPFDGVSNEDKYNLENNAMNKLSKLLEEGKVCKEFSDEMVSLWHEYEENETNEAKFVKDIDKFDMILQADDYEIEQDKKLDSFFKNIKFTHPFIIDLSDQLNKERNERLKKE